MTTSFVNPYIYKKGKVIHFKKLDNEDCSNTRYLFRSATPASLTSISHLGNNLNQVTGRCLLGIQKLLSYFGLSKDPSEQFSKNNSVFKNFNSNFERGENRAYENLEELKRELLWTQNEKLDFLEEKINFLSQKRDLIPITRDEVLDFTSKLNNIEEHLRKILG